MPLSDDDLKVVRSRVGNAALEEDLHERYDRLGSVEDVIRETLSARLANLLDQPASFTVPGDYGQDVGANISALEKSLRGETGLAGPSVVIRSAETADPR